LRLYNDNLEKKDSHKLPTSIYSCVFSHDGSNICSTKFKGLAIYDGENLKSPNEYKAIHKDTINTCCFSHDDNLILTGSDDNWVKIVDATNGDITAVKEFSNPISNCSFSSDGFFACCSENNIFVFDAKVPFKMLHVLKGHEKIVNKCNFLNSNGRKFIISCSEDKTLKLWHIDTGKCLKTFIDHNSAVKDCVIQNKDDEGTQNLFSVSEDKTLKEWSLKSLLEESNITEFISKAEFTAQIQSSENGSHLSNFKQDYQIILAEEIKKKKLYDH